MGYREIEIKQIEILQIAHLTVFTSTFLNETQDKPLASELTFVRVCM